MPAVDPGALVLVLAAELLWIRAFRVARARTLEVPRGQVALWHAGLLLVAIGLLSPLDARSDELLSAHMAQHLLIADLGAPLLLAGMRAPIVFFLLPRPVLTAVARRRRLRAAFRTLRRPLVAVGVYVVVLYAWHLAPLFEAALEHPAVHVLQHQSFVAIGILVWWAPLEPKRRRLHGELWKIGHLLGTRLMGMFLGMFFVISRTPFYAPYETTTARHGLTPVDDQRIAGGLMLGVDVAIMMFALAFFFWRAAADHDRGEERAAAAAAGGATRR